MFQSWNKIIKESADSLAAVANAKLEEFRQGNQNTGSGHNANSTNTETTTTETNTTVTPATSNNQNPPATTGSKNIFVEAGKTIDSFIFAHCATCNTKFSTLTNMNHRCRICNRQFCANCIEQSKFPIPSKILHQSTNTATGSTHGSDDPPATSTALITTGKESSTSNSGASSASTAVVDKVQYLCKERCLPYAIQYSMSLFHENMAQKFLPILLSYIQSNYQYTDYFPRPVSQLEDTTYRQAIRLAQIAEVVADITGFSLTIKALKYAYMSSELVNALISADLFAALNPLLENLKQYGITGPTALLNLYYLGCKHTLEYKQNFLLKKDAAYAEDQTGVLVSECPVEVLEYISRYVSPAQFLYTSFLPPPHDNNDWSSWYLSKMIARQEWTLLMCMNEATKLPNGNKCPAFAIIARDRSLLDSEDATSTHLGGGEERRKEVLLIIRGSASTLDWGINLQEALAPFSYSYYSPDKNEVVTVEGHGHSGIILGARTILEDYNVRHYLLTLFDNGFDIKVVGHSLGAGTSIFIAAELRNYLIQRIQDDHVTSTASKAVLHAARYEAVHRVSAIVFASPTIVSERLADAFFVDRLLLNIVNGIDVIARYNRRTMQLLADELKDFSVIANEWMEEDKMDLTDFALTGGRASEINALSSEEKRLERYARIQARKERQAKKAKKPAVQKEGTTDDVSASSSASSSLSHMVGIAQKSLSVVTSSFQQKPKTADNTDKAPTSDDVDIEVETLPSEIPPPVKPAKPEKPPRRASASDQPIISKVTSEEVAVTSSSMTEEGDQDLSLVISPSAPPQPSEDSEVTLTVAPGPVIHLYRDNSGMMKAAVIDYRHDFFQRMELLPAKLLTEHAMSSYRGSIDAVKHTLHYLEGQRKKNHHSLHHPLRGGAGRGSGNSGGIGVRKSFEEVSRFFPRDVERNRINELPYFIHHGQTVIPQLQPLLVPSAPPLPPPHSTQHTSTVDLLDDVSFDSHKGAGKEEARKEREEVKETLFQQITRHLTFSSYHTSTSSPSANTTSIEMANRGKKAGEEVEGEGKEVGKGVDEMTWLPCSVCGLEVTWPSIMHSDASRALATHNCSACGRIVCTLCAPAGEQIQGDGINRKYKVSDYRIALPWLGLYSPQRVCLHCYYDSTYPGLSATQI